MTKPTLTEAEAKQKLEDVTNDLEKQMANGKAQFGTRREQLVGRLARLDAELGELDAQRQQLAAYQDHPEGAFHYQRVELVHRGNAHMRQALVIELACVEHNLQVLENGPVGYQVDKGENPFKEPERDPAYMEANAWSDLYFGGFHWLGHAEAIDTIMRVGVNQSAIATSSPEQEQACKDRANALRQAMKGNNELTMRVTRLANDLEEAFALLDWGKSALHRLKDVPTAAKVATLTDSDWAKLNGSVLLLGKLPEKAEGHPALEALFAPAEASVG